MELDEDKILVEVHVLLLGCLPTEQCSEEL